MIAAEKRKRLGFVGLTLFGPIRMLQQVHVAQMQQH